MSSPPSIPGVCLCNLLVLLRYPALSTRPPTLISANFLKLVGMGLPGAHGLCRRFFAVNTFSSSDRFFSSKPFNEAKLTDHFIPDPFQSIECVSFLFEPPPGSVSGNIPNRRSFNQRWGGRPQGFYPAFAPPRRDGLFFLLPECRGPLHHRL